MAAASLQAGALFGSTHIAEMANPTLSINPPSNFQLVFWDSFGGITTPWTERTKADLCDGNYGRLVVALSRVRVERAAGDCYFVCGCFVLVVGFLALKPLGCSKF